MAGRILVIDDEEKLRSLLAEILSLEGFEVMEASNLKSVYKSIESSKPDALTGVFNQLPGMDDCLQMLF